MIKELKNKRNGWTVHKMTFPPGYNPRSTTWRMREGEYQVLVERIVDENFKLEENALLRGLRDVEIKDTAKGRKLTGWMQLSKSYYDYDASDANYESVQ